GRSRGHHLLALELLLPGPECLHLGVQGLQEVVGADHEVPPLDHLTADVRQLSFQVRPQRVLSCARWRLRTDHLEARIPSAARSPPWSRNIELQAETTWIDRMIAPQSRPRPGSDDGAWR